jgi:hypothetical protein
LSTSEQVHALQGEALENFNKQLLKAINEAIFSLLGQGALHSMNSYLKEHYSISPSEWLDHLDLLLGMLRSCLGPTVERTVGTAIAKRFYWKLNMQFTSSPSCTLFDYVEKAKLRISEDVKNGKES